MSRRSVRVRIRSARIATWTSGDPVSPCLTAYSPMSACLRSGVIDIVIPSTIDDANWPKMAALNPRQRDEKPIEPGTDDSSLVDAGQPLPFAFGLRRDPLSLAQSGRLGCRQGQSRDVVQHGLDRQQVPGSGETMPKGQGRIQRNRLCLGEPADREAAQFDDVSQRAERLGEVASERADI